MQIHNEISWSWDPILNSWFIVQKHFINVFRGYFYNMFLVCQHSNYSLSHEIRHRIFHLWYHINSHFLVLEYLEFQIFGFEIVVYWFNMPNPSVMAWQFEMCSCPRRAFVFCLGYLCKCQESEWCVGESAPLSSSPVWSSLWWRHIGFLQRGDSCLVYCSLRDLPFSN